jgi:dTMP kinase
VLPALTAGEWVICDRFADSTLAYQAYGHGLGRDKIAALYKTVLGDFVPDLTLVLDIPVDIGLHRAASRRNDETRYERMDHAFHERVRYGFLDIARREPERCAVIDAARDADAVTADILATVAQRLGVKIV